MFQYVFSIIPQIGNLGLKLARIMSQVWRILRYSAGPICVIIMIEGDQVIMIATKISPLQAAIEIVEQLSSEDQAELLKIVYRRLVEQRRESLVKEIAESRQAYQTSQVRRGTLDELMAELNA